MQWTTTGDRITLPYVAPEDDLQSTPATIKALAEAVVAELELATPVGAISPYMGDVAPDGWLICDGSEYDPADLPELYAVNSAFHADDAPGEFRVPDLRGRSPIGATTLGDDSHKFDGAPTGPVALGERIGDKRTGDHAHGLNFSNGTHAAMTPNPGTSERTIQYKSETAPWNGGSNNEYMIAERASRMHGYHAGAPGYESYFVNQPLAFGVGYNYQPSTGVNFIVYAGRSTTGISPLSELAPVTTRDMIEARLAEAGIGEEEVKMLKEQLEALKTTEAK